MSFSLLHFLPAAALIAGGIAITAISTFGVFRIRYVLNRLHAAAMGDSLGMVLVAAGLAVLYGWSLSTAKLILIVALFWLASPVCSHLLASLEVTTNDELDKVCQILPQAAPERSRRGAEGGERP